MPVHYRGLLRGSKFSGTHTTVIDSAVPAVKAARDCPYVTKVSVGVIDPTRPTSSERIKFTSASGGLKMMVRGGHAVQTFWVYTKDPTKTITEITTKWNVR